MKKIIKSVLLRVVFLALVLLPSNAICDSAALSSTILTDSFVTQAAAAETICSTGEFPAQWTWDPALTVNAPQPAAGGTPLIKQYRNAQQIAEYSILGSGSGDCLRDDMYLSPSVTCGPFGRVGTWRNWNDGDIFEVYPAVYSGLENQPWIGPLPSSQANYNANVYDVPKNIIIRGRTVDGVRPVIKVNAGASYNTLDQGAIYFDRSENITIENIDLDAAGGSVGRAGVYLAAGKNITLRNMRIHGFMVCNANGIFGADENAGTLTLDQVELYSNGGSSGPEHNIYIGTSSVDPSFTVHMLNSWSHDAFYGHLFKSRAQVNILEGNYFQGGVPQTGMSQAENYLVDVPNGGLLTMRNNILVKNASGVDSNAMSVTFAMESVPDARPLGVTIENNTFVAFNRYYDGFHPLFPFAFFYPLQVPGDMGFPVHDVTIRKNVFVGYCESDDPAVNYRGDYRLTAGFNDLNLDFSLKTNYVPTDTTIIGKTAYSHAAQGGRTREAATFGAEDSPEGVPPRTPTPIPMPSVQPTQSPTPSIELPGKPTKLKARWGNGKLTVTWKAASGIVTGYLVEIAIGKRIKKHAELSASLLKATFKLRKRASYTVRVYARNGTGLGQPAVKTVHGPVK